MKILFVFHEARLTGAPIALYSLVNWLSKNTDYKISFLILDGDELVPKLKEIGEVYKWQTNYIPIFPLLNRVINRIINIRESSLIKQLNKQHFDIIYFNTILCSRIINKMSYLKAIKVWHIHELEIALSVFGKNRINASKHIDCLIANSNSTKFNLIKNGIEENKIKLFYPTINQEEIYQKSLIPINEKLFSSNTHFVIGTSGYVVNRKGLKEFLTLTETIDQLLPKNNFTYIWVGTILNKLKIYFLNNKYKNRVHFIGAKTNPFPYYKLFDVFVSCSHEESFGLSAVEAGVLKKPIICFKNTGGIEEITEKAKNITVSKFNIEEMAKNIIELYHNKIKRIELGNNAKEMASDFDINKNGQQFLNILENVVSKNS